MGDSNPGSQEGGARRNVLTANLVNRDEGNASVNTYMEHATGSIGFASVYPVASNSPGSKIEVTYGANNLAEPPVY